MTESYEETIIRISNQRAENLSNAHDTIKQLVKENESLREAAQNLFDVKGRYNTEIAMNKLREALKKGK